MSVWSWDGIVPVIDPAAFVHPDATVIGEVTDAGRLEITWHGEVVVDVPPATVAHDGTVYQRPYAHTTCPFFPSRHLQSSSYHAKIYYTQDI